jgi:hypothetical protein
MNNVNQDLKMKKRIRKELIVLANYVPHVDTTKQVWRT